MSKSKAPSLSPQLEDMEGSFASIVALNILWAEEADAVAIASDLSPVKKKTVLRRQTSLVRRNELPFCLDQDTLRSAYPHHESEEHSSQKGSAELRDFMAQHRDVKPLAEIHSQRDRFVGLNNSRDVGTWAVLEQDITMSPPDMATIGAGVKPSIANNHSTESAEGRSFPYAVLQLRWEFSRVPEIVRALDNSHLAERVRGFTLETEAIYNVCSPVGMPKPLWQPLLGQDIRKVPPVKPKRRRTKDGSDSPEESVPPTSATSSSGGPNESVFSSTAGPSSATSVMDSAPNTTGPNSPDSTRLAFHEQKPAIPKKHVRLPPPAQPETATRYWNEFDDGSEFGDDTSYAIYVNPEEPSNFPGTETISHAILATYEVMNTVRRHIVSWFPSSSRGSREREREPLLASQMAARDLQDSSDSDGEARATKKILRRNGGIRAASQRSGSILRQRKVRDSRETLIFRTYVTAFLFSYIMLIGSAFLKGTSRHKAKFEVDIGVVIGVTIALFCGFGGVGLMASRRDPLSLLHRVAVVLAFCIVCAGSGYLLALVGSTE